jgi:hypothetical protein
MSKTFRVTTTLIGIIFILSGFGFLSLDTLISIPLAISLIFGDVGFTVFCLMFMAFGVGMIIKPKFAPFWLVPAYIFLVGAASLMRLEQPHPFLRSSYTAFPFYSAGVVITLYLWAKEFYTLRILNAGRVMIPFYVMMFSALIEHWDKAGMDSFFNVLAVITQGHVDPVTFYRLLYCVPLLILITYTLNTKLTIGRNLARLCTSPFLAHGITFSFIAYRSNFHEFIPMLMFPVMMFWVVVQEYDYE